MSQWTHVAAIFRVDGIRVLYDEDPDPKFDEVFGRELYTGFDVDDDLRAAGLDPWDRATYETDLYKELREKSNASYDLYEEHPEMFLPTGSEGSCQMSVWVNPDRSCAAAYAVSVFGDLRDYNDHDAVKKWFEECCKKAWIRQAVCTVNVEFVGDYTFAWRHDGMTTDSFEPYKYEE